MTTHAKLLVCHGLPNSQGLITLSTVAFAEQVSPEEVADSMHAAPRSVTQNLTGQHDIEADLDDFFADE